MGLSGSGIGFRRTGLLEGTCGRAHHGIRGNCCTGDGVHRRRLPPDDVLDVLGGHFKTGTGATVPVFPGLPGLLCRWVFCVGGRGLGTPLICPEVVRAS